MPTIVPLNIWTQLFKPTAIAAPPPPPESKRLVIRNPAYALPVVTGNAARKV